MNKLDEELMAKFLMGECSEEELCKVNAWLDESVKDRADISSGKE